MDLPPSVQIMFCTRPQNIDAIITQDLSNRNNFRGLGVFAENRSADSCIFNSREDFWISRIKCSHGSGHYNIVSWCLPRVYKADIGLGPSGSSTVAWPTKT